MWFVPEHCGVYGTPANPAIRCSGPCRKSFHLPCVNVDCVSPGSGWLWFCVECLVSRDEPDRFPAWVGVERKLPTEIWEKIFHHLDGRRLLLVRRTCRYWRDVVDGSRQMLDKLTIHFPPCVTMDQTYDPADLLPVASVDWKRDIWSEIVSVDHWWPEFGRSLTRMSLGDCEVSLATLLGMLRHTPNLRELEAGKYRDEAGAATPEIDFHLNSMMRLWVKHATPESLEIFGQVCPRLKSLEVRTFKYDQHYDDDQIACMVFKFMNVMQHSLEELNFHTDDGAVFIPICKLEPLKLKKLNMEGNYLEEDDLFLEAIHAQPLLEDLKMEISRTNAILCELGRFFPKLKRFSGNIYHPEPTLLWPSFLNTMAELEYLELGVESDGESCRIRTIDLRRICNVHISEIVLYRFDPRGMQHYFKQAPKLTSIELGGCRIRNWNKLLNDLKNAKLLKVLKISSLTVENIKTSDLMHGTFRNLKHIKLIRSNISNGMLNFLLKKCPVLHELYVDESEHFELHNELQNLKKMTLRHVKLTGHGVMNVLNRCRQIEELEVSSEYLSADGKKLFGTSLGSKLTLC